VNRHPFKSAPPESRKRHFQPGPGHQCQETAVFDDHVQCFSMRDGATFGKLSERLVLFATRNEDWPVTNIIKLELIDGMAKTSRVDRPDVGHAPRHVM
jgi:hypothetical protein